LLMKERNLPIPTKETMDTYKRMHREEVNKAAEEARTAQSKPADATDGKKTKTPAKPKKAAKSKTKTKVKAPAETESKPVEEKGGDNVVDFASLNRKDLVATGAKEGIKKAATMKSVDIVAALEFKAQTQG